ncbi:xylosidase arabinofuranosidase [Colletotrichum sp. SAR 10_65]|nr:xylosidase arabinofuranosidase [Colletotrichum sp. SAR 10_65]
MAFPANPVYASKDFVNWRLASNAVNRVSQFPVIRSGTQGNGGGMFANTLRYHNGTFYLVSTWASAELGGPRFVMFTATDPYDDLAWSNVIWLQTPGYTIDPDIFFDDDGSVVVASAGEPIIAAYLDLATGNISEPWELWAGHENTLRLTASRANLTTDLNFNTSTEGVTALFRRQEHTYFNFSVDIQLGFGKSSGDEMGISNFGTSDQHADLGIVYLEDVSESSGKLKPYFRVRARSVNAFTAPELTTAPVPEGATTFRLKANGLVIFLDTWLEKPSALPKYLDIDDVTEADYIFISHAHFDHLPGADRIAKKTGAIVIANGEAINLLRSAGVDESQLFPVAGGERIPMFTKADRDAAMAGEATPYVCTLDVTMGMKYALMRLKEIIPPDQMDEGTRSMADYMEDRDRHVFSNYDGGQLAYNFLIGPGKTLFWNGHLGGYEGILKAIEPAPDVAILAIAGRANLNGRPYNGSAASFAVDEIRWLSQPKKVYWCLHDDGHFE